MIRACFFPYINTTLLEIVDRWSGTHLIVQAGCSARSCVCARACVL